MAGFARRIEQSGVKINVGARKQPAMSIPPLHWQRIFCCRAFAGQIHVHGQSFFAVGTFAAANNTARAGKPEKNVCWTRFKWSGNWVWNYYRYYPGQNSGPDRRSEERRVGKE